MSKFPYDDANEMAEDQGEIFPNLCPQCSGYGHFYIMGDRYECRCTYTKKFNVKGCPDCGGIERCIFTCPRKRRKRIKLRVRHGSSGSGR